MDGVPLNAQDVLATFFADAPELRHPSMRGRVQRMQGEIEALLADTCPPLMSGEEATIYQAECQVDPHGAALRMASPATLLASLATLVAPPHMPPVTAEASARVRVVMALRECIVRMAPSSVSPAVLAAVNDALAAALLRVQEQRRPSGLL